MKSGLIAIALLLIALVVDRLGSPLIAGTLLVLAFAQPFILFLWLMRRGAVGSSLIM